MDAVYLVEPIEPETWTVRAFTEEAEAEEFACRWNAADLGCKVEVAKQPITRGVPTLMPWWTAMWVTGDGLLEVLIPGRRWDDEIDEDPDVIRSTFRYDGQFMNRVVVGGTDRDVVMASLAAEVAKIGAAEMQQTEGN